MPPALRMFRYLAIAEACSWAGLLVGMFFKYVVVGNDIGVKIFGPIHGALFVAYVVGVFLAARVAGWRLGTIVLGLVCAIPPFTSIWFERRAFRRYGAAQTTATEAPVTSRS
ncbi:integral membrane protein [Sinosporangium album]|uniref:Integral membrane protein n=1 Tax=Sinosporangium album TaxID=504805 RepID=A0A1G8AGT2_9ACTN|nr:integral membrane protein [Sinosporangium album]